MITDCVTLHREKLPWQVIGCDNGLVHPDALIIKGDAWAGRATQKLMENYAKAANVN